MPRFTESLLETRYRWHRANPSGANAVGFDAQIAYDRAKAELWANEHEVVINWVPGDDHEYTALAYSPGGRVLAAIGGYAWEDVGSRAVEAQVLADAREWCVEQDFIFDGEEINA